MGKLSPRIPREHNKYHGYTVRGTPHCPLKLGLTVIKIMIDLALYLYSGETSTLMYSRACTANWSFMSHLFPNLQCCSRFGQLSDFGQQPGFAPGGGYPAVR